MQKDPLTKKQRLNEVTAKDAKPPPAGSKIYYDEELKGFGLRVTAAGAKSFVLNYRAARRERRITIGSFPDWTAAAARKEAISIKRRVDRGEDPMADRDAHRAAPTLGELIDRFIDEYLPKKRSTTARDYSSILNKKVRPALGAEKVADIRFQDIDRLHRKISEEAPIAANRMVSVLSKLFNYAIKLEIRPDNPAKGIDRNPEDRRNRYLVGDELSRLAAALAGHPNKTSANATRLLLLTGARRGEVLNATWDQFDLTTGIWVKPSSHTKQAKEHRVPLSAAARQLLVTMKAESDLSDAPSNFLFPGRGTVSPQTDLKRFWQSVCEDAGLGREVEVKRPDGTKGRVWESDIRLHDLRHSFASILASSGLSLPIIGALLGHTQPATTARYAHLYDDPLRAAAERVGGLFSALEANTPKAEVTPLVKGNPNK